MPPRPLPVVVLRAPLLPVSALRDPVAALRRHPLGIRAVALASPDLAAALAGGSRSPAAARAALARYARRAAFRPTPAGLLAGVAPARLGAGTRVRTAGARAHAGPSWQAVAALGRSLLDRPEVRPHVRLRVAPSLLRGPEEALWLALEPDALVERSAGIDRPLDAVLRAASRVASWLRVRAVLARGLRSRASAADDDELDSYLLQLIDQGLLVHDLLPPLVGERPARWWAARMQALPAALRARLPEAPSDGSALLELETRGTPTVDRGAVERACAVAPLLFGLQQALAAPVAERALDPGLLAQLEAIAEWQGAGAYDLGALALGQHGLRPGWGDPPAPTAAPVPAVVTLLAGAVAQAARARSHEVALDPDEVAAALDSVPAVTPPTFELQLGPVREPRGAPPGTGWLLGLHAPAGASVGRFLPALGAAGRELVTALVEAEAAARPGEQAVDVAYAASAALADLTQHPPARARTLALAGWAEDDALTPAQLGLVVDPGAAEPLGLQAGGVAIAPVALHRVRSTTAPAGLHRLLAGWSFARQHRPWALGWGPLAGLPVLPRVTLGGFVIAPASWRIPEADACRKPGAVARWRRAAGVPDRVQVGEGDELLLLDLAARGAGEALARYAGGRAHEVWPPLAPVVDRGGRRLEVLVAVADLPADEGEARARAAVIAATASAGRVPPPAEAPPPPDWTSFRLYGDEHEQDAVLHEAVAPAVAGARRAREITAWFFLRYRAPGDPRPHLRLRVQASDPRRFERRLHAALTVSRVRGAVVAVERGPYFPETARFGGPAGRGLAERIFQADSALCLALLAADSAGRLDPEAGPRELLVLAADRLARGLGLDAAARRDLAERRRRAWALQAEEDPALSAEYRACARRLQAALAGELPPALAAALRSFEAAVGKARRAAQGVEAAGLLPALLHLQAVRLLGPRADDEQAGYVFWARALEALGRRGLASA